MFSTHLYVPKKDEVNLFINLLNFFFLYSCKSITLASIGITSYASKLRIILINTRQIPTLNIAPIDVFKT